MPEGVALDAAFVMDQWRGIVVGLAIGLGIGALLLLLPE